jgi:hypothetical protein
VHSFLVKQFSSLSHEKQHTILSMTISRRNLLAATAIIPLSRLANATDSATSPKIITNVYPWTTFAKRENSDFYKDLDAGIAQIKKAGLDGFEPVLTSVEQVRTTIKKT